MTLKAELLDFLKTKIFETESVRDREYLEGIYAHVAETMMDEPEKIQLEVPDTCEKLIRAMNASYYHGLGSK